MPSVDVFDTSGSASGTLDLNDELFGIEPNVAVMHQVVTAQLAAGRRGTSKVKTRAEVRGGGRKPWRQKGTGRARQGSIRSPQWSGGGIAHGPSGEQNYTKRVNKKLKRLALRSALSDRTSSGDLRVIDGFGFDAPKTAKAVELLSSLELSDSKVLLVMAGYDVNVVKSFRNLQSVHLLTVDQLNTYDVLASDVVVIEKAAVELIGTGTRTDLDADAEIDSRVESTEGDEA